MQAEAINEVVEGVSELPGEMMSIAQEVADSQLLHDSRAVSILAVALILMLWRISHGIRKGMVSELLSLMALVLTFACVRLGVMILRRILMLLPWEVPWLTRVLVGDETQFPTTLAEVWTYIPTVATFLQMLPALLVRLGLMLLAIRLIRFIRAIFSFVHDIPVLGGVDRVLGGIVGAVEGIAILLFALYILGVPMNGLLVVLKGLWDSVRLMAAGALQTG